MFVTKKKYKVLEDRLAKLEKEFQQRGSASVDLIRTKMDIEAMFTKAKTEFTGLQKNVGGMDQLLRQTLSFLGDVETKFEAIKTAFKNAGILDEDGFDNLWDEAKGFRKKDSHEKLEEGDIAKADFAIWDKAEGKVLAKEEDFPLRLGAGLLPVEKSLIGRDIGSGEFTIEHKFPAKSGSPLLDGKAVVFSFKFHYVKTKVETKGKIDGTIEHIRGAVRARQPAGGPGKLNVAIEGQ